MDNNTEEKVLDKGFVRLVDHMGSDEDIEQAARVSYDKGTRPVSDTETLIRYLVRAGHLTPLEMVEFKFHIKIPLFCFAQMVRHRTANLNVRSYRYSEFDEEYCYLPRERYLEQSKQNKQKSGDTEIFSTEEFLEFSSQQESTNREQQAIYDNLLEKKCAREVARIHLPQSAYTEVFWKIDLRNLFNFLKQRLGKDAQDEITQYAIKMSEHVKRICPIAWRAFEDYELNAVKLTQRELNSIFSGRYNKDDLLMDGYSLREANELIDKIKIPLEKVTT